MFFYFLIYGVSLREKVGRAPEAESRTGEAICFKSSHFLRQAVGFPLLSFTRESFKTQDESFKIYEKAISQRLYKDTRRDNSF